MKLWLDDERPVPDDSWTLVQTAEEAIEILKQGQVRELSLDHDLGTGRATGYEVACFIEEAAVRGTIPVIRRMFVHSANPVGRERMKQALHSAYKIWSARGKCDS